MKSTSRQNFQEFKRTRKEADKVAGLRDIDIGRKCRTITRINYEWQMVHTRYIVSHGDYDKGGWKDDCYD